MSNLNLYFHKILFLNPVGIIGGGERVLLTMMAGLKAEVPDLQLHLLLGSDGPLVAAATALGVQVEVLPLPERLLRLGDSGLKQQRWHSYFNLVFQLGLGAGELAQYRSRLTQMIRTLQPDLIHSNGIKTHLLTGVLNLAPIPVIWHLHDFYTTRPLIAKVLGFFRRKASAGIAISQAVAVDGQQVLKDLPISVIYNGIDTTAFAPESHPSEPPVSEPSISEPKPQLDIGLIATFARWKGHDLFLEAAAKVIQALPEENLQFWIVGGAVYKTQGSQFSEQELRELATHQGIIDQVVFAGFQTDVQALYHQLDIVVHASTQPEPFGMTIIEAMACGKPVIVSQAGGAAELFNPNVDALGFRPGDADALAQAMRCLIISPELRTQLAENARKAVVSRFAQKHFGREILALYQLVCSQN
jgi:glycosyltransferase involved in cell wall biosynthesis